LPEEDASCPECGAGVLGRGRLRVVGFALAAVLVAVVAYVGFFQRVLLPPAPTPEPSRLEQLQKQVEDVLSVGGTVTKVRGPVIWVEPGLWQRRSDEDRRALAALFGTYAGLSAGTNESRCEVRDNRTGAIIAIWTEAEGLIEGVPEAKSEL
jgi:hypothetical protein